MVKVFLLMSFLSFCSIGFAQSVSYKPFEVDAGILFAFPTNQDLKLGAGGYIEPKYNIHDQVALGIKTEFVLIASEELISISGDLVDVSTSGIMSFLATGDYYFINSRIRPFAGIGAGIYITSDIDYEDETINTEDLGTRFGLAPRAGFVVGHFRMAMEYNIIPSLKLYRSRNYISLKLGFEIGGGRIR